MDEEEVIIKNFTESLNKLEFLVKCHEHDDKKNYILNLTISYMEGSIIENGTNQIMSELYYLIKNKEIENITVAIFLLKLDEQLLKNNNTKENYDLLKLLLNNIHKSNNLDKDDEYALLMTRTIWNFESFRNSVSNCEKCKNGIEYMYEGLFCSLIKFRSWNPNHDKFIYALGPLINDEKNHIHLLKYLDMIIDSNESYTSDDENKSENLKCSSLDYCDLILEILLSMINHYTLQNINSAMIKCDDVEDINRKEYYDIVKKLFSSTLEMISICQMTLLKKYRVITSGIVILKEMMKNNPFTSTSQIKLRQMENNRKRVMELLSHKKSNLFVQNIYIKYMNFHDKIDEDYMIDILTYVDILSSLEDDTEFVNIYGKLNKNILDIPINIMGNNGKNITNPYTRISAACVVNKTSSCKHIFPGDYSKEIFINYLKFLSDIDFIELINAEDGVNLYINTTNFLMEYVSNIDMEKSILDIHIKDMDMMKILYNILKKNTLLFTKLNEIYKEKFESLLEPVMMNIFEKIINGTIFCLSFIKDIYEKNIILKIYPEVEYKFFTLIECMLNEAIYIINEITPSMKKLSDDSSKLSDDIDDLAKKLLGCVYINIDRCIKNSGQSLSKSKKILIENINNINVDDEYKKNILKEILKIDENNIEYPSEFLDPITCEPIRNPIKIPNVDEIFDKTSISISIMENGINPYNREELNMCDVEEYNNKEEVKEDIINFIEKKNKFEEEKRNISLK
jgi:hypothetical protein